MVHLQSLQLRTTCLPCSRISQVPSCPSQSIRCIPRPIVAARVAVRAAATADDEEESGSAVSGEWPVNWSLASYEDVGEFFQNNLFKQGASPASSLAEVMSKSVTTTNPEASIDSVKSLFDRISGVPVVKSTTDPTLVGVLSKKDLNKSGSKVGDIMSSPPIAARASNKVADAAVMMLKHKVHRIPVVDDKARCIGIVTRTDIFTALALDTGNTATLG